MSTKKAVSAVTVASGIAEALSTSMTNMFKQEIENLIVRFTEQFHLEYKQDRKEIMEVWGKVAPAYIKDTELVLHKEDKKKEAEAKRIQKKEEEKKGPHCDYEYGEKSKRADKVCRAFCKDPSLVDGKHLCNSHRKQVASKHECEFVWGPTAAEGKRHCPCGTRVTKGSKAFEIEGEYEGREYVGKWLCAQHTTQVTKALEKVTQVKGNQCTHETTKSQDPARNGRCTKECVEGENKCKKHLGKKGGKGKENADERKKAKTDEDGEEQKTPAVKKTSKKTEKAASKKKSKTEEKAESKEEKKLEIKLAFKLTKGKPKKAEWVMRNFEGEDDEGDFNVFVDTKSGLVCLNPDDTKGTEPTVDSFQAVGVWNNDTQAYDDLTKEASNYAQAMDIPVMSAEEQPEAESEAESGDEE